MGETISYSGGGISYVDRAVEITPDTLLPDSEAIGEIRVLRARMDWLDEENKRLRWFYENMRDADRRNLQMEYEAASEAGKELRVSKPSESPAEVRAKTFVRDNRDLLETAGPLTLQTIARAGSLISVELCDEVVQADEAYENALHEGAESLVGGEGWKDLSPKRVAAVESRIPTLKATYERKARTFDELSNLTGRAIERYQARNDAEVDEAWREILDNEPPDMKQLMAEAPDPVRQRLHDMSGTGAPVRPWWKRLFG